jgi:ATP-dependent protease ClpP protease subunit
MENNFFSIKNELGSPVIHINGEIGWSVNYGSFRTAIMELSAKGNKSVKLIINSVGGDMIEGFAMYDFVKSLNMLVEVEIIGMAASMAGVFAQCASPGMLAIHENALVMTHRPQSYSRGESDQHRTAADVSDRLEEKAKAIYIKRGADPKKMADWFKPGQMKWFTAEEALAAGIVDRIIKHESGKSNAKLNQPINTFKSESEAFKYYNSIFFNKTQISMNKLLLGVVMLLNSNGVTNVAADSSEEDVLKAVQNFVNDQKTKISNLNTQVQNSVNERAKDLVASFKNQGKLPKDMKPEDEAKWVEMAAKQPEMFNQMMSLVVQGPSNQTGAPDPNPGGTKIVDFNQLLEGSKPENNGGSNPNDKKTWTIRDWEQKDPEGLKNILVNNKVEYHKMFKAFYNVEPFPLTA